MTVNITNFCQIQLCFKLLLPLCLALATMLTIVITDSRGRYLDTLINDEHILVSVHSGAKLRHVAAQALQIIPRFHPDNILLMAGINDITCRNRHTRRVHLISNSPADLINHLILELNRAKSLILNSYPNVRVVLGGIIGINLNAYNRYPGISRMQWVVDNTITAINSYIRQVNHDSGVPHPRLVSKVHAWRQGFRHNIYNRLRDGLHPSDLVLEAWSRQIKLFHAECVNWFTGPLLFSSD